MSTNPKFQPKQYIDDANRVLGQSNGKTYQRVPGQSEEHDGQVMVRLRKKRFVVLDYSFAPTDEDKTAASSLPHVRLSDKAGKAICIHVGIGVPVCVYDSDPTEQEPLYMRSGFCFSCQRNLNHERRSERKRPSIQRSHGVSRQSPAGPDVIYCVGPKPKHFKVGNRAIQLKEDALIISGTVPQMAHHSTTHDLGHSLVASTEEAYGDATRLVNSLSGRPSIGGTGLDYHSLMMPPQPAEFNALYEKTFQSLSRSLVLLAQWKSSWDSTISAANETMADQSLVDAVASAVADNGVLGSPVPPAHDGNNMVSLLLDAAGQNKDVEFTNNLMHSDDTHQDPTEYAV